VSFGYKPHPIGWFAKGKAIGCRCRRSPKGNPKVPGSLCHVGNHRFHETVMERIEGKRLCRAWQRKLLAEDPLDVEL
jgi:hypothetical protein